MAILWQDHIGRTVYQVPTNEIPLMLRRQMIVHPKEILRDWSDYKPDNRRFYRRRFDLPACIACVLFIAFCWGLAIYLSCK